MMAPFGPLRIVAAHEAITAIYFEHDRDTSDSEPAKRHELLDAAEEQLNEYLEGKRQVFDMPLRPSGTEFQRAVYRELLTIAFGETRSYSDIARAVGRPDAVRAVGAANGRNPIAIVIPCHRVIGKNGSLTGYGGGIETKRWLLDLEKPLLFRS
ncbi:methylated-DNA--[protein]-cysteine S-methyltransferase [Pendulispora brunnea]|uniref:Methylated-DNA--protein-cysteine methyltransferase n=2 Tax=Pendulispora brunnea TaxID=2905690 RepID=A0ABZ2KQH3_9BACT